MKLAAGILFVTPKKSALFLKRGAGGDYPGSWCFPGGHAEPEDKDLEATARREATEELGSYPKGDLIEWTRTVRSPAPLPQPQPPGVGVEGPAILPGDGIDFTTFIQRVDEEFVPTLNGEHEGYAWAPLSEPPQPMHPGCEVALLRFDMNELGVAKAMAEGRLTSPQRYENVDLFCIRITGTGAAYRSNRKEYVWRDPSYYLNAEFLQRCAGLPVIFEHPKTSMLNSKEFNDRTVGTVLYPFIRGEEVWGVAKIYDAPAVRVMRERQLSTSPGVSWRDMTMNLVIKRDDGSTLLIEGDPSLLDHIAVCGQGVWDKGGDPTGVQNDDLTVERTDSTMKLTKREGETDAEFKIRQDAEDRTRLDADAGTKLDTMLSCLDSIKTGLDSVSTRMDAFEEKEKARDDSARRDSRMGRKDAFGKRKDGESDEDYAKRHDAEEGEERERLKKEGADEKEAKDKAGGARKDAEGEEASEMAAMDKKRKDVEEKERADSARTDSAELSEIRAKVDDLARMTPRSFTDEDHRELSGAQARADAVLQLFGKRASIPMIQETVQEYRLRIARELQGHSPTWKGSNLAVVAVDSASFDMVEKAIYADAEKAALNPTDLKAGEFRTVTRTDSETGRRVTEFHGADSFVKSMSLPPLHVKKINRGRQAEA